MPELPEVEMQKRYFDGCSLYQRIAAIEFLRPRIVKGSDPGNLAHAARGREFVSSCRRGKYLLGQLSGNGWLVFHFGMDGHLEYRCGHEVLQPDARAVIRFENGCRLTYNSWRMLGRIELAEDPRSYFKKRGVGPDALGPDLDLQGFRRALSGRKRPVKSVLMDQHVLSGIGNLYADEILFQARLHPSTPVDRISDKEMNVLFGTVKRVLQTAVDRRADIRCLPGHYLLPRRHPQGKCPECGSPLKRITLAGRTGYYCPHHQQNKRRA